MITLVFRPVCGESLVLVRGTYFRICSDGTLRGPDNCITGSYSGGFWEVGCRLHRSFECGGLIRLRVTDGGGGQEHMGPYDFIRAAEGALFTRERCLGTHASRHLCATVGPVWREIAFLAAENPQPPAH
ncbi:MAG TPA: hypothetical protein VIY54_13725 [Steroidobacteraceae bacterium]